MAMLKTQAIDANVAGFLVAIADDGRKADAYAVGELPMQICGRTAVRLVRDRFLPVGGEYDPLRPSHRFPRSR